MKRPFLFTLLAVATLWHGALAAQDVKHLGSAPSADDLIKALTPQGAPPARAAAPAATNGSTAAEAPSVALDVKFEPNSTVLSAQAKNLVRSLAEAVNSAPLKPYRFRLEGHTDSTGSPDYNVTLSKRRAEAVKAYMVQAFGVPSNRLEAVGYGMQRPLDAANPESGVNRRVQVLMLQ
jgi:outer membrane protein OmpA-like peptidoglycan-associated protein